MAKLAWYGRNFISVPVHYCLCLTEEQYQLAMKQADNKYPTPFVNEGSNATTHIIAGKPAIAVVCVKLNKKRTLAETNALIVHESVHIFQEMMRQWGEENVGDETQAYFIQRISLDLMGDLEDYYEKYPDAHPDYRKHHKKGRNVVRQRR